jgi:predicted ATP-dependent protease
MLGKELVEDCKAGKFHIYSISSVDEAIELLTGLSPDDFSDRVQTRLEEFARDQDVE